MFRLKRYNVIKVVDSKHKMEKLIGEGFALTSQPSFGKAVESTKPETSEEGRVDCPYCDKDYASLESLKRHIKEKHPEKLEEYIESIKE